VDHPNYENFQRDLSVIGLRQRRVHDARRSFVCLSLADGARRDILRWITHGPEGDIVSLYTTLPWDALCAEVAKLKIDVRAGQLLELRKAASSGGNSGRGDGHLLPRLLQPQRGNGKAASAQGGTRTQLRR